MDKEFTNFLNKKHGFSLIQYFVYSVIKMIGSENFTGMMDDWKKASLLLHYYTIENKTNFIFPLTLSEQKGFLVKNINEWGLGNFEEIEGIEQPILYFLDGEAVPTDLAIALAQNYNNNPGAENLELLKNVIQTFGKGYKIYTQFRELLITNVIMSKSELNKIDQILYHLEESDLKKSLALIFGDKTQLIDIFESHYTDLLESDLIEGNLELCPYCGYPLGAVKIRNYAGEQEYQFKCLTSKCLKRKNISMRITRAVENPNNYLKLKKQVMYSVVLPGKIEMDLFCKLKDMENEYKSFNVSLFPCADKADLHLKFNDGIEWAVDAKDWTIPAKLAYDLNNKGFLHGIYSDSSFNISKAFLVLPNDSEAGYINTLKARWKDSGEYEVLRINQFLKEVEMRCSR